MIIGVPTFAVIYALFRYKINRRLRKKNLPTDTVPYISLGSIESDGTFMEYVPIKGRTLLQILGIKKMDVVKREIIVDDEPEYNSFQPGDVNLVDVDLDELENESNNSIAGTIAETLASKLSNLTGKNNNDEQTKIELPDGADDSSEW